MPLEENPNWTSGRIGGTYQWDTTYIRISDPMAEGEELVYTAMLSQPGQQTQGIYRKPSMVFAISANTEHPEAAAQILNCLMNEEAGVMAVGSTRGIPASTAAREMLMAAGAIGEVQIEAQNRVLEGEGPTIHPFIEHPDVRAAMIDALEMFAYGRIDAATAAEEMLIGIDAFYFCDADGRSDAVQSRAPAAVGPGTPRILDITLEDVTARNATLAGAAVLGLPEAPVLGLTLRRFAVSFRRGAEAGVPLMAVGVPSMRHVPLFAENARIDGAVEVLAVPEEGVPC